jgi:hypothetical protein
MMSATARRLPTSICARQTQDCATQAQFQFRIHPECRRMYAKYLMLTIINHIYIYIYSVNPPTNVRRLFYR